MHRYDNQNRSMPMPGRVALSTLAVIVPVHDGGDDIEQCLCATGPGHDAITVVDDSSSDGSAEAAARRHAIRYLMLARAELGRTHGAAAARNAGAATIRDEAEWLIFVDADVVLRADAIWRFAALFKAEPDIAAAFGSYDDTPRHPDWINRYKNLLHHRTHQLGAREAATFWSGCGAARRDVFEACGGFDAGMTGATIEDIEFGVRLRDAGHRIVLERDIQCTHLKRWTFASWLRTDIFGRALPWSRLLMRRGRGLPDTLNLGLRERLSAVLVCSVLLAVLLVLLPGMPGGPLLIVALCSAWSRRCGCSARCWASSQDRAGQALSWRPH